MKYLTFIFALFYFCNTQAQGLLGYRVDPIPLGANAFTVVLTSDVPDPAEGPATYQFELFLQIIDKADVDNALAVGEDITSFFEAMVSGDGEFTSSRTIQLPDGMTFQENLPDNKVYRLVNKGNLDAELIDNDTFQNTGFVSIISNDSSLELSVGENSRFSNIDVSFTDRSASVLSNTANFTIATNVEAMIGEFELASAKFQIHIVDRANLFIMEDVSPQEFISESAFMPIPNGNSNLNFTLDTPAILSENLPEGKVYRIRLVNGEFNDQFAFPFPYELSVRDEATLSNTEIENRSAITLSPNPATDTISINTLKGNQNITIYTSNGLKVYEHKSNAKRLDVSFLNSGLYVLVCNEGRFKFVKN